MPFTYRRFPVTYNAGPFRVVAPRGISPVPTGVSQLMPMRPGGQKAPSPFYGRSMNGHRAVCTELRRGVNHAVGILLKGMTRDVDGATLSLHRCAENLTVR
jgi:hypothetical protein